MGSDPFDSPGPLKAHIAHAPVEDTEARDATGCVTAEAEGADGGLEIILIARPHRHLVGWPPAQHELTVFHSDGQLHVQLLTRVRAGERSELLGCELRRSRFH